MDGDLSFWHKIELSYSKARTPKHVLQSSLFPLFLLNYTLGCIRQTLCDDVLQLIKCCVLSKKEASASSNESGRGYFYIYLVSMAHDRSIQINYLWMHVST
jgi:hypothetical protein